MTEHSPATARAMRVRFDPRKVFPLDDPMTVPLLRLMLATDDVRHLQKLIIRSSEGVNEDNKSERAIREGEQGHLFRLICGHLYEAGDAFRALDGNRKFSARLDAAVANTDHGELALAFVREAYRPLDPNIPDDKGGLAYSFLYHMRHFIGFHYKDEKLREAFVHHQHSEVFEGSIVLAEWTGLGRYTLTDLLAKLVIADAVGGDVKRVITEFPDRMRDAIKLAGNLGLVTDYLVGHMFKQNPAAPLEREDDLISIHPSLRTLQEQLSRKEDGE